MVQKSSSLPGGSRNGMFSFRKEKERVELCWFQIHEDPDQNISSKYLCVWEICHLDSCTSRRYSPKRPLTWLWSERVTMLWPCDSMPSLLWLSQALRGMKLQQPGLLCWQHASIQNRVFLASKTYAFAAVELLANRTTRLKVSLLQLRFWCWGW